MWYLDSLTFPVRKGRCALRWWVFASPLAPALYQAGIVTHATMTAGGATCRYGSTFEG